MSTEIIIVYKGEEIFKTKSRNVPAVGETVSYRLSNTSGATAKVVSREWCFDRDFKSTVILRVN
jgi:hypothetical protein